MIYRLNENGELFRALSVEDTKALQSSFWTCIYLQSSFICIRQSFSNDRLTSAIDESVILSALFFVIIAVMNSVLLHFQDTEDTAGRADRKDSGEQEHTKTVAAQE